MFPTFLPRGLISALPCHALPCSGKPHARSPNKLLTQDGRLTLSCWLNLIATTKLPFCRVNAVKKLFFLRCLKCTHSVDFSMAMPLPLPLPLHIPLHMPGYAPASLTLTSPESRLIVPPAVITSRRHLSSMPVTVPQISEPPL